MATAPSHGGRFAAECAGLQAALVQPKTNPTLLADWQRVVSRITEMEGTHRSWFPGTDPRLDAIEFETFWCPGSVIAHVSHPQGPGKPQLDLRLQAPD